MTRARDLADLLNGGQTITTSDNTTQLTLSSTDADANVGPVLDLVRDSGSPADSDLLGSIKFIADDDGGNATTFASVSTQIGDASNGTESCALQIKAMSAGSLVSKADFLVSETVFNNGSKDIDFRVESNGNANMLVVDAGNDKVGIGTNSPAGLLDLDGGSSAFTMQFKETSGAYQRMGFQKSNDQLNIGELNNDGSSFTSILTVSGNGDKVGIGTTSPSRKLELNNGATGSLVTFTDGVATNFTFKTDGSNVGTFGTEAGSTHLAFMSSGTERLRINSSGHINIGQTSTNIPGQGNSTAGTSLRSVGDAYFSRDGDIALNVNRNGSDGKVVSFRRGGTEGGSISVTTTSATLASSSDARLKSNIEDAASASDKIDAIQVRQFDWIETGNHQDYGLIAQELQPIEPLAVVGTPDSDEMMGIDNSKLVPMLIKEIQSLRSRVAALEASQ